MSLWAVNGFRSNTFPFGPRGEALAGIEQKMAKTGVWGLGQGLGINDLGFRDLRFRVWGIQGYRV